MKYQYLFGPIQSRRLGKSLGIDLIPAKTCSLDCIYCECGSTTFLSAERKEYIPASAIISELQDFLRDSPVLDFITFGGSGEPTLNSGLGEIVRYLKSGYSQYKTALLTNGTLFHLSRVREDCLPFDLVLPSLDAVSSEVFAKINRPDPGLQAEEIIAGLIEFAHVYHGRIWLEIFIVPGINDSPDEIARLKEIIPRINPDRVQLNSLDRPGTEEWVVPASRKRLEEIAALLKPLPVEIIARNQNSASAAGTADDQIRGKTLAAITRRPCTEQDIAAMAGISIHDAQEILEDLRRSGLLKTQEISGNRFFIIARKR
jgi:wyosine [tRNA(Phe)-imidazoG37] synthetase (radical SAM superfamily)